MWPLSLLASASIVFWAVAIGDQEPPSSGSNDADGGVTSPVDRGSNDSATSPPTASPYPMVFELNVDLGGIGISGPAAAGPPAQTNPAGRSFLASLVETAGNPDLLAELRNWATSATDVGGNLFTDNFDSLLEHVGQPLIEGAFGLAGEDPSAQVGAGATGEILVLIAENDAMNDLTELERSLIAMALQEVINRETTISSGSSSVAGGDTVTVWVINEASGKTHTWRAGDRS